MRAKQTQAADAFEARQAGAVIGDTAMPDVNQVAAILNCSPRHVYRLSDAGRMPPPIRLGALVRWRREQIENWIAEGCPPVRAVKGGAR